ncbi:MAG: transketolase family protein [Eubacteriales bacterium]|jgi:transketolase|nr:transketolase family protein [Eubacteriales bacterium]HCX78743.1 transketolase [Bacillota bacterium]
MAKTATRDAYGKALAQLGAENEQVVVLDADLSGSTKTAAFAKEFPRRFFNLGIAEADLIGTAAGLAAAGKIPFASTFAVFAAGRAYDQIRASVAYPKLNVKIAATHAGLTVGEDGATHQMNEDIALMRALPNMTVVVPADGPEAGAATLAVARHQGPVYLRLGRPAVPDIHGEDYAFDLFKAPVLREGGDVAIFACGYMVHLALEAAAQLEKQGISAAVVNVHTIKPLDKETVLRYARRCGRVIAAEEHSIIGGLGSAIAEVLGEEQPTHMVRIGVRDTFGESGKPAELLEKYGLTAEAIVQAARKLMQ